MGRFQTGNEFLSRVPQVSVLGHTWYIILNNVYINDLDNNITSKVLTFADNISA